MKYQIIISIRYQNLLLVSSQKVHYTYKISSSMAGSGQLKGSYQTPLSHHIVRAKIGDNAPIFTVFKARRATGKAWSPKLNDEYPNEDFILSRILWLSGKEKGLNRLGNFDSMQRFIYIHGTNEENFLGSPASHGCIRMANQDVISLYNLVDVGTDVFINEE